MSDVTNVILLGTAALEMLRSSTDDHDFDSNMPDHTTLVKVLATVSAFGWLLFGIISILFVNGPGRRRGFVGTWAPEWYLGSERTRRDKSRVGAWWVGVILLWPGILLVFVATKLGRCLGKRWKGVRNKMRQKDEETAEESAAREQK